MIVDRKTNAKAHTITVSRIFVILFLLLLIVLCGRILVGGNREGRKSYIERSQCIWVRKR